MPSRHCILRRFLVGLMAPVALAGCMNSPFAMPQGRQALRQPSSPMTSQYREMKTRTGSLDAQNQQLHAALAQQQQQTLQAQAALQRSQQELADARRQLDDTGGGSIARKGVSARNASLGSALPVVRIPGAEVVPDGDLVRIRVESSQLFAAGRAELKPEVAGTLDRIASVLKSEYAGRLVGIEGHTDSDPITKSKWKNNHELAVARSVALFSALKSRGVSESQLFVAGYGPNRPLTGGDSKQSKSQNRRVEIVVYPEMVR
ncbi:MAG: flagellar motor protein MotB [Planctomycetales bacterium]